jgi:hypothetical protein
MINFTNPRGVVTEAVAKNSTISTVGLCNVPIELKHHKQNREKRSRPVLIVDTTVSSMYGLTARPNVDTLY